MIQIDWKSGIPAYDQIVSGFIRLKAIGAMLPGEKLPSVRSLAMQLGVNPNTVQKAYLILEEKASLPFEVGVFKNTSPYIRGLITQKLVDMNEYNIDNIYSRFDDTVIMCVVNNSENADDYVNVVKVYDEIINFFFWQVVWIDFRWCPDLLW